MKTEKEINQLKKELTERWLDHSDKEKAASEQFARFWGSDYNKASTFARLAQEHKQKANLCYVFLHALYWISEETQFNKELTPFSYNQVWTDVLELPGKAYENS